MQTIIYVLRYYVCIRVLYKWKIQYNSEMIFTCYKNSFSLFLSHYFVPYEFSVLYLMSINEHCMLFISFTCRKLCAMNGMSGKLHAIVFICKHTQLHSIIHFADIFTEFFFKKKNKYQFEFWVVCKQRDVYCKLNRFLSLERELFI